MKQSRWVVFLTAGCLALLPWTTAASSFSDLVVGVSSIGSHYMPGPLLATDPNWVAIASGDDDAGLLSTYAAARTVGSGGILVMQPNGLSLALNELDNSRFLLNAASWLHGAGPKTIVRSSVHNQSFDQPFVDLWTSDGYTVRNEWGPITPTLLSNAGFLWIASSWDVPSFTESELTSIEAFVNGGGGLLITGLGWSFPGAMTDYPPNIVGARFGIYLLKSGITDPTDHLDGGPVFHRLYPNAEMSSSTGAADAILTIHRNHPSDLDAVMETDAPVRSQYLRSLLVLDAVAQSFPEGSAVRAAADQFFFDLMSDKDGVAARNYLRKSLRYPQQTRSMMTLVRERLYRTWLDQQPLTQSRATAIAAAADFSPAYASILAQGVYLADNAGLDAAQLQYIDTILGLVPPELHNLRFATFLDLLRNIDTPWPGLPPELSWWDFYGGVGAAINSFSSAVGVAAGNPFPDEVPAGTSDLFSGAFEHELNHIVDAVTVGSSAPLRDRKSDLIARAGRDHLNYLYSVLPDGFLVDSPQEFFASISNQWFVDSEKTLRVGAARFDASRPEPLNHALFFAEVYSQGGDHTFFYNNDAQDHLTRQTIPVLRDAYGHITELQLPSRTWSFTLDPSGNVLAYQSVPVFLHGDTNGDSTVGAADIVYLINNLLGVGPAPIGSADVNGDGSVNVGDIFYFVNFLFAGGPAPK